MNSTLHIPKNKKTVSNFFIVDAFTSSRFGGNPAGVILTDGTVPVELMQNFAGEIGLSETAFVWPVGAQSFAIRWFTPTVEAELCGHATLAASHIIWQQKLAPLGSALRFKSRSGILTAAAHIDGWIELGFPSEPCQEQRAIPNMLIEQFGSQINFVGRNRLDDFVELDSESAVRNYIPNFTKLAELGRGLIITARSDDRRYDFVSRVFAPSEGIPEDPVTGSAHCCLAPYWAPKLKKTAMTGRQLSKREGVVKVIYKGERTHLKGQAVTVISGCTEI